MSQKKRLGARLRGAKWMMLQISIDILTKSIDILTNGDPFVTILNAMGRAMVNKAKAPGMPRS